ITIPLRQALATGLLCLPIVAHGQTIKHTFDSDVEGWMGFGQTAKVEITKEAANVKEGAGALQFSYSIEKGQVNALVHPVPEGALAKIKSVKFWIKTDHATPIIVMLQEKEGGHYATSFTSPKDQWQRAELALSDFYLAEGKDDPKDRNVR